jgi:hypothetical protein
MGETLIQGIFHGLKTRFGRSMRNPDSFSELVLLLEIILFSVCIGGVYDILCIYL